jgi:PKD repeat protein
MNPKVILPTVLIVLALLVNTSQVRSQFYLDVTVKTDETSYTKRELVNIQGNVTFEGELVQDGLIGIQIENPLRSIILRTLPLTTNLSDTFTTKVTSLFLCDAYGQEIDPSMERSNYIWFNMTVKNEGFSSQLACVSITILDNALIPLDLDMASFTIPSGKSNTFMPRMYIPNWATIGTAFVYANVYNSYPKDGGRPICPEEISYFNIIESIYAGEPSNNTSPDPPAQNGIYETGFRLPPDMLPGAYEVTASAWCRGYTGSSSTSFNVYYVPSPPWSSFVAKPPTVCPGYPITFDASSSSPEGYNDSITSYFWTFGDTTNTTGKVVTHGYANVGNYSVTLNVTDNEGFWNTTSRIVKIAMIRNIAVTDLQSSEEVYNDWLAPVTVTVKNKGATFETFNVTLYSNSSFIETKQVTNLGPLQCTDLTFTWNTTGLILCANYTLEATADTLENETDTTDNTLECGPIWVKMLGDIDGNRKIDIFDVVKVAIAYKSEEGDPNWDFTLDLKRDGIIDIFDVVVVCAKYNTSY